MATGARHFRTVESIAAELVTRAKVPALLSSRGFSDVSDEREQHGTAITQIVSAVSPTGEPIKARVRLCWRRGGPTERTHSRKAHEAKYSAAQLAASVKGRGWDATLDYLQKRDEEMGITHTMLAQQDGDEFAFAALIPTKDLAAVWRRQRDVSAQVMRDGLAGKITKNHAMNGSSPTLWLQDDRAEGTHRVPDALWSWPGVQDLLKMPAAGKSVDKDDGWSQVEMRAAVSTYREMWLEERSGTKPNKAAWRRKALEGPLSTRSPGAFEYRMQNISAVLDDFDIDFLTGYLPKKNVGPKQTPVLIALVNEFWGRQGQREEPTADPDKLRTRVRSARQKRAAKSSAAPPPGNENPERRQRTQGAYDRLAEVIDWVLEQAKGVCEACGAPAPFVDDYDEPFLEVHHVRPLAQGGPDRVENAAALCPNCHRRLHYSLDKSQFRAKLLKAVARLVDYPAVKRT